VIAPLVVELRAPDLVDRLMLACAEIDRRAESQIQVVDIFQRIDQLV
jgi:hypothetical protein